MTTARTCGPDSSSQGTTNDTSNGSILLFSTTVISWDDPVSKPKAGSSHKTQEAECFNVNGQR